MRICIYIYCGEDDDQDVPTASVGSSLTLKFDDAFCSSVVRKLLLALVQALGSEKVETVPVSFPNNDISGEDDMDF